MPISVECGKHLQPDDVDLYSEGADLASPPTRKNPVVFYWCPDVDNKVVALKPEGISPRRIWKAGSREKAREIILSANSFSCNGRTQCGR